VRGLLIAALAVIALFFGGLGTWAALAPLSSAAVAPGQVTVAGNRKSVQHLEGGIIKDLLAREGDRVELGQVLLRLEDTQARAALDRLRTRYDSLLAREARLIAQRSGEGAEIHFPQTLLFRADEKEVADILDGERAIFAALQTYLAGRKAILKQRVEQLHKEIDSLRAQVDAEMTQLRLIRDEKASIEKLFAKDMVDKPRLLAAMREEARLEGSRGEHLALIARAEQRIGETELEIIDLDNRLLNEVTRDLTETQAELMELTQEFKATQDVLERTEIRAPVGGTVVALDVHTEGAVLSPGQRILDIVPSDDNLEVEARIDPNDIDVVHAGLAAEVMLTAYKQRTTPTLTGRVSRVSADSFSDPRTGRTYFLARVTVAPEELERITDVDLYPGMPAEVLIRTGEQTALDYILGPITQSMRRAFRES
jgi:HlyD family type I secretion membrane fusion protein